MGWTNNLLSRGLKNLLSVNFSEAYAVAVLASITWGIVEDWGAVAEPLEMSWCHALHIFGNGSLKIKVTGVDCSV